MKLVVYLRVYHGLDEMIHFNSIEAMQFKLKQHKDEDFEYLNVCAISDCGDEDIIASGLKEALELK